MNQRRALEARTARLWIGEAQDHLKIGEAIPDDVRKGEALTIYSGGGRYPDTGDEEETTTREEYDEAMEDAAVIVGWAAGRVEALVPDIDEAGADVVDPQASARADRGTDPT